MPLILGNSAGARPAASFGTANHPDPVAVPTRVPGASAGYRPDLLRRLLRLIAALHRRHRMKTALRELSERPDHVLRDAGVPLDMVRGAQAHVDKAATVTYTGR